MICFLFYYAITTQNLFEIFVSPEKGCLLCLLCILFNATVDLRSSAGILQSLVYQQSTSGTCLLIFRGRSSVKDLL